MSNKYQNYLFDLGLLIKERALEVRRHRDKLAVDSPDRHFQSGRVIAYNEIISLMQQQAEGFGISLSDLRLDDIEPDRDLT